MEYQNKSEESFVFDGLIEYITNESIFTKETFKPVFKNHEFCLYNDDCLKVLSKFPENYVDMIFADPPYMLSNDGITCQAGRMVSVNKGKWDKSNGFEEDLVFHNEWIQNCKRILKPEGTIWISGTYHSIFQCGFLLQKNGFHILNDICWFKPNAAPNLSCRYFTASHETLIWAKKDKNAKHAFNYELVKKSDFPEDILKKANTQMRSVWSIPTPKPSEKYHGKHPTQKPIDLLIRIIMSSTNDGAIIVDPFNGSGTTGIASKLIGNRKFIGIDISKEYIDLTLKRYKILDDNGGLFND